MQPAEHLSDVFLEHEGGVGVHVRRIAVDEDQPVPAVSIEQPRRGIDIQRGSSHNHCVRSAKMVGRSAQDLFIERLPIEDDVGLTTPPQTGQRGTPSLRRMKSRS